MDTITLLTQIRNILYQKYGYHFLILEVNTFLQAMDAVHYKYEGDKLYLTLTLQLPPIEDVPFDSNTARDYSNNRG